MKQDLFKYIPPEIITNIFLKLPVETIASSKCVCKPWRDLIETDYFVTSHLAKSVPSLAMMIPGDPLWFCRVLEFEDEQLDDVESDDFRYNQVTKFDFPHKAKIVGAANGLLLLRKLDTNKDFLYICNPITRHYVEIPGPKQGSMHLCGEFGFGVSRITGFGFGFGVSRITGQYKVVRIIDNSECYVYTLGTGSWRRIAVEAPFAPFAPLADSFSAFVDGRIHWAVKESSLMDMHSRVLIVCFDLETECFSSFRAPASHGRLSVSSDCLCFVEGKCEIVVWLMKEYGVEKSWSKEYVFNVHMYYNRGHLVYPIKLFETGDLLMVWNERYLIYYSNKTKTEKTSMFPDLKDIFLISSMPLTPSFLSLKGLGMENVISF